jgi:hypothetical protein
MALWTVIGVVVAVRFFRWEPKVDAPGGGRRRAGRAGRVVEAG